MIFKLIIGNDDGETSHEVKIKNEQGNKYSKYSTYICSLCECPEDAIIGRDLLSGHDLWRVAKLAYEAGKAGEDFILKEINEKEGE